MMLRCALVCLALTACTQAPTVAWQGDTRGPAPALLPLDMLAAAPDSTVEARGAALAAQAAALQARAATIGTAAR